MSNHSIIEKTVSFAKKKLMSDGAGHDWWHVYRVWKAAKYIASYEKVDTLTVELAALLHDIADWKFHDGDDEVGPSIAAQWLSDQGLEQKQITEVCNIIREISFKGAAVTQPQLSLEGQIVQDADRLDALGAIGIARTFAYGGYKGRLMYDPNIKPIMHSNFHEYKNSEGTTVNHFYEKLLLLKDRMNTKTGRRLAEERHRYMESYLDQFYKEWDGVYE